jgi:tetratricopeptide (TPR) repeat protein
MARYGRPTPELRYRKAWMLIQFARNYQILGDTGKQFERANEAYDLLAGLAAEKPDDKIYQRDLSVAYAEVGDVLLIQGKLSDALRVYRESLAIVERLTKADPGNAGFQFDLAIRHELIGDVLLQQGDLAAALAQYEARKTLVESLTRRDPGNSGWQRDLADCDALSCMGLFGRLSPRTRVLPGSKEFEVSKLSAVLLLQLMFVCLLAGLRAEPQHPFPMYD